MTDPKAFKTGREFAAWIGLVPRQNSTGGKERLGSIPGPTGSHHAIITLNVPVRTRRNPTFPSPSLLCAGRDRSAA